MKGKIIVTALAFLCLFACEKKTEEEPRKDPMMAAEGAISAPADSCT